MRLRRKEHTTEETEIAEEKKEKTVRKRLETNITEEQN